MSILSKLRKDYRSTWEAYKDAKELGDKEVMASLSNDLVRIADRIEQES